MQFLGECMELLQSNKVQPEVEEAAAAIEFATKMQNEAGIKI